MITYLFPSFYSILSESKFPRECSLPKGSYKLPAPKELAAHFVVFLVLLPTTYYKMEDFVLYLCMPCIQ